MADINDVMNKLADVLDKIADNKEKIDEIKADVNVSRSVQQYCHHCGGDGIKIVGAGTASCPDCGGDGYKKIGRITSLEEE